MNRHKTWLTAAAVGVAFIAAIPMGSTAQPPSAGRAAAPAPPNQGVDKMCETNMPIQPSGSDWTHLGVDDNSSRYQPKPGIKAADVPKLKLKWSFAMAGGGGPTVIGDWLFIANRNGRFYALDAKTGCVHWVSNAAGRTTPMVVKSAVSPSGWVTLVGDRNRTVRAIDAQSGKDIWKSDPLEANPVAGITGTPVISGDRVFVPLTSSEEVAARQDNYACCTFRGSLATLDLKTGKKIWQTYVITEPLKPTRKNAKGVQLQGPAGGAIWSAPTVDEKRGLVYIATGDSYTEADTECADAIVAMDIKTGKTRWTSQVTEADNFIMGCLEKAKVTNCPTPDGPDHDFGATPILMKVGGKQVLVSGQKSGMVYGMNPDTGKVLWSTKVGMGSGLGGIEWGMAADPKRVFVAISDGLNLLDEIMRPQGVILIADAQPKGKPGLSAVDPGTGKILWTTPAPIAPCKYAGDRSRDTAKGACIRAQSAAPGAMPGVVFSGTMDGWFRAYDAATGKIVWQYSTTAQTYDTVNGVKGQPGGSIDGMGPAIAGGMVYTMSGFNGAAQTGGNAVNVLLAFSVDGK
ncbi:PQQ-binding-like beta-propeller repeat protein [soil metagenome]